MVVTIRERHPSLPSPSTARTRTICIVDCDFIRFHPHQTSAQIFSASWRGEAAQCVNMISYVFMQNFYIKIIKITILIILTIGTAHFISSANTNCRDPLRQIPAVVFSPLCSTSPSLLSEWGEIERFLMTYSQCNCQLFYHCQHALLGRGYLGIVVIYFSVTWSSTYSKHRNRGTQTPNW